MASRTLFIAACAFRGWALPRRARFGYGREAVASRVSAGVHEWSIHDCECRCGGERAEWRFASLFATQTRFAAHSFVTAGVGCARPRCLARQSSTGYGSGDLTTRSADAGHIADVSVENR